MARAYNFAVSYRLSRYHPFTTKTLLSLSEHGHKSFQRAARNFAVPFAGRVRGDVLVELDPKPYQVQVVIKQAAVDTAQAQLAVAQANVRGLIGQARSNRFKLARAQQDSRDQGASMTNSDPQTKFVIANPQATGMLMPQIPTPKANSTAIA